MRGRLTLEKVNAAINDMATYAEANAQLIAAPKKKVFISKLCGVYLCVYNLMVFANNFPFLHEVGRKSMGESLSK